MKERIKNIWNNHGDKIILVGGLISLATITIVTCKYAKGKLALIPVEAKTEEEVIEFIKKAGETVKYAIFKESETFNVVTL